MDDHYDMLNTSQQDQPNPWECRDQVGKSVQPPDVSQHFFTPSLPLEIETE